MTLVAPSKRMRRCMETSTSQTGLVGDHLPPSSPTHLVMGAWLHQGYVRSPAAFSSSISDISLPSPAAMIQLSQGSHLSLDTCLSSPHHHCFFRVSSHPCHPLHTQQMMQHSSVFYSCCGSSFSCHHPHPSIYSSVGIPCTP